MENSELPNRILKMRLTGKQIMLIDDDEVLRTLLTRTLTVAGCIVHSCSSVRSALNELKANTPDLVILDLNMPEHDGFTFLKFRFQNKVLAAIPVIILSGLKDKNEIRRALEMGADQFLEKPFESRLVLQKLRYIFFSKANFVYRFPTDTMPAIDGEVQGTIIEQTSGQLKVESQVKFHVGKSVQIHSEDYVKSEGKPIVCKVDSRLVELKDGFFRTILNSIGLDPEDKKHFEDWQRTSSK